MIALSPAAHAIIRLPGLEDPIKIGVEAKHISNRDWKRAGASPEVSTVTVFFLKPTFEVMEGLDVFFKYGKSDIDILVANGLLDSAYGIGIKYSMPGLGLPGLGILEGIGEALEVGIGFDYTILTGDAYPMREHSGGDIRIAGWNLSVSAGFDMGMFAPYVGLRYSDATLSWTGHGAATPTEWNAADNIGILLGANIPRGDLADINIELGFLDGTSLKLGTNFVF